MDSLLCDEDWLKSPPSTHHYSKFDTCMDSFYTTLEDCKDALMVYLKKENSYMPELGYVDRLHSSNNLLLARIKAIHVLIKYASRLDLGSQTVFNAVNYFDRFISTNKCNIEVAGFVELLSVACLSISAKFGEVSIPQMHEFQMDDQDDSVQASTIQLMELEVLKALGWRLNCITSFSYKELLLKFLDYDLQPQIRCTLSSRVTELLFGALSDPKFIQFRPSTIAVSALRCSLEELAPSKSDAYLFKLLCLIPQDQKVDINKSHKIMEEQVADPLYCSSPNCCPYFPSSPVTVMQVQRIDTFNCYIDLSLSMVPGSNLNLPLNPKKRKREEDT
ncbi:hypothetical protein IFM89_000636, partial [Coptis chinensis]